MDYRGNEAKRKSSEETLSGLGDQQLGRLIRESWEAGSEHPHPPPPARPHQPPCRCRPFSALQRTPIWNKALGSCFVLLGTNKERMKTTVPTGLRGLTGLGLGRSRTEAATASQPSTHSRQQHLTAWPMDVFLVVGRPLS